MEKPETHPKNSPTKPDVQEVLKRDYSLGATGKELLTSDEKLRQIISLLERDAEKIAQAENKNFIYEYYNVITAFLMALDETIPESVNPKEHAKKRCIKFLIKFYTPHLQEYSKKLRTQQSTKRPIMLGSIFFQWRELFTNINFSSKAHLNTAKMVAAKDNGFADSSMKKTMPHPALVKPPSSTPTPPPIPSRSQSYKKIGTVLGMQAFMTPTEPIPQYPPQAEAREAPWDSASVAKMINDTAIATSSTQPAIQTMTIPKEMKKDFEDYNNHEKRISKIYDEKFPVSPKEWEITMRHLQQAMAENFNTINRKFSAIDDLTNEDRLEILKCMANAINKIGNSQFRKRLIHEVYTFTKSVKPANKKEMIRLFAIALSKQNEYENPREITATMKKICENYQVPLPEQEYLAPDTLVKGYDELDGTEIADMPIEIRRTLSELHSASQEFGLRAIIMSGGTSTSRVNIAGIKKEDFETLCMQTFEQLNWIENRVKKRTLKLRTWGKSYKKARQFTHELRQTLTAQLAITEELLFSKELFIHEDIQPLIKT